MQTLIDFLLHHGYVVLLGWVFAEQVGLPVPTMPLLLAAGALAGAGRLNFFVELLFCVLAAMSADAVWYELGRRKGVKILHLLCKISLEPDSCVRRTEGIFAKEGARSLLLAKFIPGLGVVTPPLAGIFHMRRVRFLLFDGLGASLWAGAYLGVGFIFSGEIERIAARASALGSNLGVLLITLLAAYIAYKYIARQRFLRELRIARMGVDELKQKLDSGESVVVVDLRHSMDFEADPQVIPGAMHMDAKELEAKNDRVPRDREVVLYCT